MITYRKRTAGASETSGQSLTSSITARLREQITCGAIPPSQKLHLDDLRASFGVSLSPLREALSRLSAEGFVVAQEQRGYTVAPVSEKDLLEVTRLRADIESIALREAVARGTDLWESDVIASLYRLNKIGRSSDRKDKVGRWELAHRELHTLLLSACDMPLLMQFCATLHDLSDRYRRLFLQAHPIDRDVEQEHVDICRAALERRTEDACAMLRDHIERTGANVLRGLLGSRGTEPQ